MADSTVAFRIKVDGAPEASADVQRVRTALEGVQGTLDAGGTAAKRYAQTSTEVGAAEKQAAGGFDVLSDASRETHKQLFEGARLGRSFVDVAVGEMVPGLSGVTGEFTRLSRETGGFSTGMVLATAGLLGVAAAVGHYLTQAKELREAQVAVNKALEEGDYNAAQAGFKKSEDAIRSYEEAQREAATSISYVDAATGKSLVSLDALSLGWTLLKDGPSGVAAAFSVATTNVGKNTEILSANAAAVSELWDSYQRGKVTLETVKEELEAQSKANANQIAQATSLGALAAAYEEEGATLRGIAQTTIDLKTKEDERYASVGAHEVQRLANLGQLWEAAGRELDLEEELGLRGRQRAAESSAADEAAIARRQADEEKVAGFAARELEDAGKLINIKNEAAIAAIKAGQDEADARQKVADADAKFFGTALEGLSAYQTQRRASIEAAAQLEIANIEQVYQHDRAALQERADALPAFSLEQNALYDKLDQMDEEHNAKLAAASAKLAQARLADDAKTTEERRANYAREVSLAEATYAQLAALGQEDVAAHIQWAQQKSQDENLGKTDRMKYEKEAFEEQRKLENDLFALSKALGLETEVDVLQHLANETARYAESSSQRIKAETEWANEAKKLRNEVADIGKSQLEKIVDELKAEGNEYVTLGMVMARWSQDLGAAQGAMSAFTAGGATDIGALKMALDLGPVMGQLQEKGVYGFQAVGAEVQRVMEQLFGVRDTAKGATQDLAALAVPLAPHAVPEVSVPVTAFWRDMTSGAGAAGQVAETTFGAIRAGAGEASAALSAQGSTWGDLTHSEQVYGDAGQQVSSEITTAWQKGAQERADAIVASFGRSSESAGEFQARALALADDVTASFGRLDSSAVAGLPLLFEAMTASATRGGAALGDLASSSERVRDSAAEISPQITGVDDALADAAKAAAASDLGLDALVSSLNDLGSAGGGAADMIETSFDQLQNSLDQIGGSLGDGLKSTLGDTLSYVDDYWGTLNDKIRAGASTTADNIFGTLNDRIKNELDAEARAS